MLFKVETNDGTFYTETSRKDLREQCLRYTKVRIAEGMKLQDIRFCYGPCVVIHHNGLRHHPFTGHSLRDTIVAIGSVQMHAN